ncbi:hypothetical protein [Streptomyces albogriseolus]|uniref:hypothetical protein n=1 Tax=Streptomyces albogriseolus TaxID=1887 RepID=UPI0037B32E69
MSTSGQDLALTLGVARYGGAVVGDAGTLAFAGGTGGRPGRAAGRRAAVAVFPTPQRGTPAHQPHG